MATYFIRDLEKLSGIKAHTIRIWEKRHKIIAPKRTDSNIRYYDDYDLKKLLNISILNSNGFKISNIALMKVGELNEKVVELSRTGNNTDIHIDRIVICMLDLDEARLEKLFSEFILKMGFEETIIKIIYPFLAKIGVLWQTGNINPAQEHFICNIIRQKIIVAIDSLPLHDNNTATIIMYLPDEELHELGLLFYSYVAKKNGCKTIYLGQSVPYENLKMVDKIHQADILFTAYSSPIAPKEFKRHMDRLVTDFRDKTIIISGYQVNQNRLKVPLEIFAVEDVQEFKDIIPTCH